MSGQTNSAADILRNTEISGSGLLAMLPYFKTWAEVGESEIMLQDDVVKGMRVFSDRNDAEATFISSRTLSQGALPVLMYPLIINAYPALGYQLALKSASGPLLREGLTIQAVLNQLGPPEQVRERLVTSDDRDVKPIGLKEYSYAGGAVVFAVLSDAPDQNTVEIAILNVPTVTAALLSGGAR
jgi:hypothetical protein